MSKKLLLIAALGVAGIASAQSTKAVEFQKSTQSIVKKTGVNNEQRATIFSENFANGLGQFTVTHGAGSTAPHWTYNNANQMVYIPVSYIEETASIFEEYLTMTNPVTIPNDGEIYRFQPEIMLNTHWLKPGSAPDAGGGDFKIEVTNDNGGSWTTLWCDCDQASLDASFTGDFLNTAGFEDLYPRITIPAAFKGIPVKFRFALTGTNTASAYIYSAVIKSVPTEVVEALDVIVGDIDESQEYKVMPLSQTRPAILGVVGKNFGTGNVNRNIRLDIAFNNTIVETHNVNAHNFVLGVSDTIWFTTTYTPSQVGNYIFRAILEGATTDFNDTVASRLQITDYTYSQFDRNDIETVFYQNEPNVTYGTTFEQLAGDGQVFGINTLFYNQTTVGANLDVYVYKSTETGWAQEYQGEYIVKSSDISPNGSNLRPVYIPFEYGVDVYEGDYYMIALKQRNSDRIRLLGGATPNEAGVLLYGPFGQNNAINWYRGWDVALVLEADYQDRLAVSKVEGMENVTLFPNPSNGIVNISNSVNEVLNVNVTDITGKVVASTSVFGNGSIDLGNFGAGVYVFEISNGTSRSAQRVIVK